MINVYKSKAIKKYLEHDDVHDRNPNFKNHGITTRKHMVICGKSGSGKTNFIVNLLNQMSDTFAQIYIFTAMIDEPIYRMLNEMSDNIHVMQISQVIAYDKLPDQRNNKLIIFDDFITQPKPVLKMIETYAILSRKIGCSCLFLVQNYFSLSTAIRNQASYIVLLKNSNKKNLNMISAQMGGVLDVKALSTIIDDATKQQFDVCIVDLLDSTKMLRKNFDQYYTV